MGQNEVKLTFIVDASGMITGVRTATGEVISFGKTVEQTGGLCRQAASSCDNLQRSIVNLTAKFVTFRSAAEAVKASLTFLGDMESATLGIASSFLTGGKYIDQFSGKALNAKDSLAAALQDGKSMMEELQVANFQTIATLDQLVRAYQETLPVAMAKGFNREQVKAFTVAMVQAAGAIGMSLDMLGEETRSILTGTINPRTSRIATVLGLTNEEVRAHSQNAETLFNFLLKQLEAYKIAGIEAQNTWKGLLSNTKDIALWAGGMAMQPLFDAVKYDLQEITSQIGTIDETTKTIKWNPEFLEDIRTFKDLLTDIIAEIRRFAMFIDKIGGSLTTLGANFARNFNTSDLYGLGYHVAPKEHPWVERFTRWNEDFRKHYERGERALQDQAMRQQGYRLATMEDLYAVATDKVINVPIGKAVNEQEQRFATYVPIDTKSNQNANYKQNPAKPDAEAAEKAATAFAKLGDALGSYQDRLVSMNPALSETDKLLMKWEDDVDSLIERIEHDKNLSKKQKEGLIDEALSTWWQGDELIRQKQAREAAEQELKLQQEGEKNWKELQRNMTEAGASELDKRLLQVKDWTDKQDDINYESLNYYLLLTGDANKAWEMYEANRVQISQAGAQQRAKIEADYTAQLSEMRLNARLSELDYLEQIRGISKGDAAQERVALLEQSISSLSQQQAEKDPQKDTVAWLQLSDAIQKAREQLSRYKIVLQQQTGSFSEGLAQGMKDYIVENTKSSFEQGADFAKTAADSMKSSFKGFFDYSSDSFLKLDQAFGNMLDRMADKLLDFAADQTTNWFLNMVIGLIGSVAGSVTSFGASSGVQAYNSAYVPDINWDSITLPSVDTPLTISAHQGGYIKEFHGGGLARDEVPAILRKRERVLDPEQNIIFQNLYSVLMDMKNGPRSASSTSAGQQSTTINIHAWDSKSVEDMFRTHYGSLLGVMNEDSKSRGGTRDLIKAYSS